MILYELFISEPPVVCLQLQILSMSCLAPILVMRGSIKIIELPTLLSSIQVAELSFGRTNQSSCSSFPTIDNMDHQTDHFKDSIRSPLSL